MAILRISQQKMVGSKHYETVVMDFIKNHLVFLGDMLSKKKPFVDSPSSATQGKDKKLKMVFPGKQGEPETETAENDEDYEPTAMLGMMSEFQREAGLAPKEAVNHSKHLQASLSVSRVSQRQLQV